MNIRTKTTLIMLITFLSGIIVGFVLNGVIIQHHFYRETRRMRSFGGFYQRFEDIVQPTDQQREAMRDILKKHFEELNQYREQMPAKFDTLRMQLEEVLSAEQIQRLDQSRLFRFRGPGHPPDGPKPFDLPRERPRDLPPHRLLHPDSTRR